MRAISRAVVSALALCLVATVASAQNPTETPPPANDSAAANPPASDAAAANPSPSEAAAKPAPVVDADGFITAIDMLTIGPGEELWTSFGHTALHVLRFNPETKEMKSRVFNWGDADFGGFGFVWSFFRGRALFRLTEVGSIEDVVNLYATRGRTVVQQRLALTPPQVAKTLERLEYYSDPSRRDYVYHHMNATCGTKVRDMLDDELIDGAIRAQLGDVEEPIKPRAYGRKYFAGFFFAELFNDLFLGRLHDEPWTKFDAVTMPEALSENLQLVKVPDPKGGTELVALAGRPVPIVSDVPPPAYRGEGRSLIHLTYLLIALVAGMGVYTLRRKSVVLEDAGFWLFIWSLPVAGASLSMVFGALMSSVAEGRVNELLITFPPTDVLLVPVAILWWRGKRVMPKWLELYVYGRMGLVALALLGHATGVLIQEPRVLLVLATVCAALLVVVVRRFPAKHSQEAEVIRPASGASSASAA